jgi:hypothetical protein
MSEQPPGAEPGGQRDGVTSEAGGGEQTTHRCVECGGWLPDEIVKGAGVYCPTCGHGQHPPE